MTKKTAMDEARNDIELLLDSKRIEEASRKYGEWYIEAYDLACDMATKSFIKSKHLVEQVRLLNGVIEEQEREVEKYEKDAKGIQKLRKNISQFLTEFGNADDEITKAQMYVLKCCLITIEE